MARRMLPPIQTKKHIVQQPIQTVLTGTTLLLDIAEAVATVVGTVPTEIEEGSVLKACYVELWIITDGMTTGSTVVTLYKNPGGSNNLTHGLAGGALNQWTNKKNIFNMFQGLVGDQNTNTVPVFRSWYKIPKGKQRFGLGDKLTLSVSALSADVQICGFFLYKEYQ